MPKQHKQCLGAEYTNIITTIVLEQKKRMVVKSMLHACDTVCTTAHYHVL